MQIETWRSSDNRVKHRISGSVREVLCWCISMMAFSMALGIFAGSL